MTKSQTVDSQEQRIKQMLNHDGLYWDTGLTKQERQEVIRQVMDSHLLKSAGRIVYADNVTRNEAHW